MIQEMNYDVVIVGAGVGGLYTALHLPKNRRILIICKEDKDSCDSMLAQGGICVLLSDEDYPLFFEDTMKAGHYENRKESVDIMLRSSRAVIDHLLELGVRFEKNADGSLRYTREGAHSRPRICFHKDITGKEITTVLQRQVEALSNVTLMEYTEMTDLLVRDGVCEGIVAKQGENVLHIRAKDTVLATGGIGGLYERSTNFPSLTGDGVRIAQEHGVEMENLDYVQIHPTSLYTEKPGRSFLISESTRGEGAILLNANGERFVDELLPRDVVTNAIEEQMKKEGSKHVWLSFENIPTETILEHFPNIRDKCLEEGYDITKEPIPVVPAQHYFMGGIHVDRNSATTMKHLYAVGETSCNGVHGKNRLASNSLLESLVFAQRAAYKIAAERKNNMNTITMNLAADRFIRLALEEDINSEDVTTNSVMPEYQKGEVQLICKQDGIIAGLGVFERVFTLLDPETKVEFDVSDGDHVTKGQHLATVIGDIRVLLSGERTALNYLQRMSGIATYTNSVAKLLEGTNTTLLDTRKTTPCMRIFEKYAVKVGGGSNHRYNLSDGVLLKDNHIDAAGGVKEAIEAAKKYAPFVRKIEVETENLDMVKEAVEAGADIIMLDNMTPEQMAEAIRIIDGRAKTECSGNITKENIATITSLGVDYVSSGALTHSAPILDISLKHLRPIE